MSHHLQERGFVLPALLAVLTPLLLLAGAATTALQARNRAVVSEVDSERALLAAESGLDVLIHKANRKTLVIGQLYQVTFAPGVHVICDTIDLSTDGQDNDGDGVTDEADEDAIEARVTGFSRKTKRKLVAYLRPMMDMPTVESAVMFQDFTGSLSIELDAMGVAFNIDGTDRNIDGTVSANPPVAGATIVSPGTTSTLLSGLTSAQQNRITGAGGTPSAAVTSTSYDVGTIAGWARSIANNYITPGSYSSTSFTYGNAAANDWQVTMCDGDLSLTGNLDGAGILVIMGDLEIRGDINFTGLVVVTGKTTIRGGGSSSTIRGGLIAGGDMLLKGTVDLQFSSQTLNTVGQAVAIKRVVTGWREVAQF